MPCYLCTGAVIQFGVPKVVIGEDVTFPGGDCKWGGSRKFLEANGIEVIDLNDPECIQMMTDFIRSEGLLPEEEIDRLIEQAPKEIVDNQQAFANGLEIPSWHDFLEQFTPEDAVEEIAGCSGCNMVQ